MAYRSDFTYVPSAAEPEPPDYVYYNADIINNNTGDYNALQTAGVIDPPIRFNETRDTALIRNAQDYYFSIIRFTMDGPNKDLPLFIPDITEGTGQTNVNLTNYSVAISYQQTYNLTIGAVVQPFSFNIVPNPRFVVYQSETKSTVLAPSPLPPCNPNFVGQYSGAISYTAGQVVSQTAADPIYSSFEGPFFRALQSVPPGIPLTNTAYWVAESPNNSRSQDISTRYYWVYTYQHWLDLVNQTLNLAFQDTYNAFQAQWVASGTTDAFPYATYNDFLAEVNVPNIQYNPSTTRFTIYGDSDAYGTRILNFFPAGAGVPGPTSKPTCRLFFNGNMFGLFTNFPNQFWNDPVNTFPGLTTPEGYTNEILFPNKFYQNILDMRLPPYSGIPPLGYVPLAQQKVYWINEQEILSTDSLWSPISSIVFTSTLLPIKPEQVGPPVILGQGNIGFTSATSQSAFQPIITDIALNTASGGAQDYRSFIYYAPTAEYRLSDFGTSKQDIRNIDIQVFWKCRLDNQLYPITMFNLSSVSIKVMFRHKEAGMPGK